MVENIQDTFMQIMRWQFEISSWILRSLKPKMTHNMEMHIQERFPRKSLKENLFHVL